MWYHLAVGVGSRPWMCKWDLSNGSLPSRPSPSHDTMTCSSLDLNCTNVQIHSRLWTYMWDLKAKVEKKSQTTEYIDYHLP